jgi:hypothetical protein
MSYLLGGTLVSVPIYPATITVHPQASLVVKYFLDQHVSGYDSINDVLLTPQTFYLDMLIGNTGYGTASNMQLSSGQPTIIDNALLLLGCRVAAVLLAQRRIRVVQRFVRRAESPTATRESPCCAR